MKGVGAPVLRGSVGAIVFGNNGSGGGIKLLFTGFLSVELVLSLLTLLG